MEASLEEKEHHKTVASNYYIKSFVYRRLRPFLNLVEGVHLCVRSSCGRHGSGRRNMVWGSREGAESKGVLRVRQVRD